MKDLKNLKGAKMLSKIEQKGIKGGRPIKPLPCDGDIEPCSLTDNCCVGDMCGHLNSSGVCIIS